jgi:hypothetical protein
MITKKAGLKKKMKWGGFSQERKACLAKII